jgi:hypothetical protein
MGWVGWGMKRLYTLLGSPRKTLGPLFLDRVWENSEIQRRTGRWLCMSADGPETASLRFRKPRGVQAQELEYRHAKMQAGLKRLFEWRST